MEGAIHGGYSDFFLERMCVTYIHIPLARTSYMALPWCKAAGKLAAASKNISAIFTVRWRSSHWWAVAVSATVQWGRSLYRDSDVYDDLMEKVVWLIDEGMEGESRIQSSYMSVRMEIWKPHSSGRKDHSCIKAGTYRGRLEVMDGEGDFCSYPLMRRLWIFV